MAESWYKGQELEKGSFYLKNKQTKTYKEQGRLELLLKQKIMESFLEMKHMLLKKLLKWICPQELLAG